MVFRSRRIRSPDRSAAEALSTAHQRLSLINRQDLK
jgi:hypothetical protein